jgi:hypothetical protein
MQPWIDELESAWNDGVRTYDRATRTNFKMWMVCSREVAMPNMQASFNVHLVAEGCQEVLF